MSNPIFNVSNTGGRRAVTSAGQRLALGGGGGDQIRVYNKGPDDVCLLVGDGTQSAVFPTDAATSNGAGLVMGPGVEVFSIQNASVDVHAICDTGGTATIYVSRGNGQ